MNRNFHSEIADEMAVRVRTWRRERDTLAKAAQRIAELDALIAEGEAELNAFFAKNEARIGKKPRTDDTPEPEPPTKERTP